MQKALAEIRQHQISHANEHLLEGLKPPEFSAYDPAHCCLPGTRSSVLQNLEQWSTSPNSYTQIFWLYGVAGCGKSAIATSLASVLDSRNVLAGSYFCKRDLPERRDPIRLVRALAYYLGRAIDPFRSSLLRALREDSTILDKPLCSQFKGLLTDPMSKVVSQSAPDGPIIFILDALDECNNNENIASLLLQLAAVTPWLRIVITSRPLPKIKDGLNPAGELMNSLDLSSLNADDDIKVYIHTQLAPKGYLYALRNDITDEDIEVLVQKASGYFIWITSVCSYISFQRFGNPELLRQILESEAVLDCEKRLDALYQQVLNSVALAGGATANKDTVRLLVGLVHATSKNQTLPVNALHSFVPSELVISLEELETLLLDLGSVLTVDMRTKAIRACHPSLLVFLGSPDRSGDFWTEPAKLDTMVTERCFHIMLAGLKFNICELESSYSPNSDVKDIKVRIDQRISRELQYSCLYWLKHLLGCKITYSSHESIWQMAHSLLSRTTSLYWIEVLSLLSELKEAGTILRGVMDILKDAGDAMELYSYTADLHRFVKAFHEPVLISTPHVYISALLWIPSESIIAKSSIGWQFMSPRCVLEGRNKQWPANLQTLPSTSSVYSVAYSPDGLRIVSGSNDKILRVWDARTGMQVGEHIRGHDGPVRTVSYSPDGLQIVSGSDDRTLRIWDAETGESLGEPLLGHEDLVLSLAYSPDGKRLVSASNKSIRIWDISTRTQVGEAFYKDGLAICIAYSPDGGHVVSGSADGFVRIWDAQTGLTVGEPFVVHKCTITIVAYSPDGRHVAIGSSDATIRIWNAQNRVEVGGPLRGPTYSASLAYSPDGRYIVSCSADETIRIWDTKANAAVGNPLRGHTQMVNAVAYSPDGHHVVSGSSDATIRIWDVDSCIQADAELFPGHSASVQCVAYSPDGSQIASASCDGTLRRLKDTDVTFSPNGRHIVSGSSDETLRIWDIRTGRQVGGSIRIPNTVKTVNTGILTVAYSPDGRNIAFGSRDNTVRICNAETGAFVGEPLRHENWVNSVAYSPDGKHIVSGSYDATVRIWNTETGATLCEPLKGHEGRVLCVAYSPDGSCIVSGSNDKTIRVWSAQTGTPIREPIRGHSGIIQTVAYSPDGRYIVSGSDDKTVRIWNAQNGIQVGEQLRGHSGFVFCVAYSPDGNYIISGASDYSIRIWDAHPSVSSPVTGSIDSKLLRSGVPVDGWIRTSDDGLLLWVPPEYRDGLFDDSSAQIPRNAPGHPVRIDWNSLPQGNTWSRVRNEQAGSELTM